MDGGRDYTRVGFGGPEYKEPWIPPATVPIMVDSKEIEVIRKDRFPY